MAALTAATTTATAAHVHGLSSSGFNGRKLSVAPPRVSTPATSRRKRAGGVAVAKYGEKSIYFDLEDISNTTGAWDLYGSDTPSPYNSLQSKFFETFAKPFTKRGLLLKFLLLAGGGGLAYAGANATGDILPIVRGPQQAPTLGPRGKI